MESRNLISGLRGQSQSAADAMDEGGWAVGEGKGEVNQVEAAMFFDLELPLAGDRRAALEGEEDLDFLHDGDKVVTQYLQATYAEKEAGHGAVAAKKTLALGPAARLRSLVRRLRRRKKAEKPAGTGGAAPQQEQSRSLVKARVDTAPLSPIGVFVGEDRRVPKAAVLKYLTKITTLARRRGDHDAPALSAPNDPQAAPGAAGGGSSRARTGKRLGKTRSSVAAAPPRRSDGSMLQVQDGIESAIAHCKLSLDSSRGPESPADEPAGAARLEKDGGGAVTCDLDRSTMKGR